MSGASTTAAPPRRFRVTNVTRDTVLATAAESADNSDSRRKGLLGRDALSAGRGLLIAPCEAIHTFGMRFPIDVVYLARDLRVIKVRHALIPWRISFCLRAHSVLELPAGTIGATLTVPGDRLVYAPMPEASRTY